MRNSSVQLLRPDGSSARSLCEGELELLSRNTPDLSTLTNLSPPQALTHMINHTEYSLADKQWMYTDTQGQRVLYKWVRQEEVGEDTRDMGDGKEGQEVELSTEKIDKFSSFIYKDPLLKSWQRDPVSEEELVSREDQLITVLRKDGTRIVQFADGTRLTSSNTHSQIQIECTGYAKVCFSTPSEGQAVITLFDGNDIVADRRGTYSVTSEEVLCNFTQDGNSSVSLSNVSQVDMKLIGGDDWITVKNERTHAINKEFKSYLCKQKGKKEESLPNKPIPRMFVLSRDGSGIELLSKEYSGKELERWRAKDGMLLQSHALPGDSTVIVHSVISPINTPSHKLTHLPYTEDDIIPINLRTQYYFPLGLNKCEKDKDMVFGSGVGRGLDIGTVVRRTENKKVPRGFRRRELLEHKPIGQEMMSAFVASLNAVNSWWDEINKERDSFSPVEIKTDSVQEQATDIFNRYNIHTEDNDDKLIQEFKDLVLSPPTQETIHASSERRPERVEADRAELEEFQANLQALRTKDIPGYFYSEDGNKFLQNNPPDIQRLTDELPIAMRRGRGNTPPEPVLKSERLINPRLSELSQEAGQLVPGYASTTILLPDNSTSTVSLARDRPDNPSPHISTSADPSIVTTEESPVFSPSKLPPIDTDTDRPNKATPVAAGAEDTANPIPEYLFYNVAGIPRTAPVKLPNSLKVNTKVTNITYDIRE
ncbi:Sperm-associated antigen 17-like [Oopsacas minuta]|uniref:Sperm-associated antigen 17-like n=1 Tax=Oopsacas minuta TaxID=111878 RepID=A0AAV7JM75_9METZ|nr:Sperm-associated antigen 17-like [Oopsacas minuta]